MCPSPWRDPCPKDRINVYSEPGQGTTFKIYIPRTADDAEPLATPDSRSPEKGSETILLVEDDMMVKTMTEIILENLGYKVISAGCPEKALELFKKQHASIQLMITDAVMPKMNGRELHDRMKSLCFGLKALFMSGYTTNVIVHHGVLDEGVHFISKPFSINDLSAKISETLDYR